MADEQPIEVHRYLNALRRSWKVIVLCVAGATALAIATSYLLPSKYVATATVVEQESLGPLGSASDVETVKRRLATIERLLSTSAVLDAAADRVGGTRRELKRAISSAVDGEANIIEVSAESESPRASAAMANAVASALIRQRAAAERAQLATAREQLNRELERLRARGGSASEIAAVRDRLSEISVAEAGAGGSLQLAQRAESPETPSSPRPFVNGAIAFFVSAFLCVLVFLAREQLRPRISGQRELSTLTGLSMLAGIPRVGSAARRHPAQLAAMTTDAFQTLQAAVSFELQKEGQKVILVTSAVEGEGKTTVVAGLGRAFGRVGRRTLLISADLRLPSLHEQFRVPEAPGLTDLLKVAHDPRAGRARLQQAVRGAMRGDTATRSPNVSVIPSGARTADPSALLFGGGLTMLMSTIQREPFDVVIIDAPPLLGVPDTHALMESADAVLLVARPDRLTVEDVLESKDRLDRLDARVLGLAVIGVPQSLYYGYGYGHGHGRSEPASQEQVPRGKAPVEKAKLEEVPAATPRVVKNVARRS